MLSVGWQGTCTGAEHFYLALRCSTEALDVTEHQRHLLQQGLCIAAAYWRYLREDAVGDNQLAAGRGVNG